LDAPEIATIARNGKESILVQAWNDKQIISALEKLIKNDALRKRMQKSCMERARIFNYDSTRLKFNLIENFREKPLDT